MDSKTNAHRRAISCVISTGIALLICGLLPIMQAAETKSDSSTAKKAKPEAKKLTGAELYSMHCNRCHPERYPTEWTPREWQTIMAHMRVRANLPAAQSKEILKYLKEESGNP